MRVIVFSDSHGSFHSLDRVVKEHPEASLFMHLGDGCRECDDLRCVYPEKQILFVRGNCDWDSDAKTEGIIVCDGKKIFFTHGHNYGVKRELGRLIQRALSRGADIACFGHTHHPVRSCSGGLHLLNPGSVSSPRGGKPSYGVIDLTAAGVALNTVYLQDSF